MPTTKKYSLPRDFAEKWIAALRSGEHKQGTKKLGNKYEGYCCLGLGCIVASAADGELNGFSIITTGMLPGMRSEIYNGIPDELKGGYLENDLVAELTEMNDTKHYTFDMIADWIEENVEFV